jgi:deazaflavin-dependent oxidoreductase (nitroreductase family)
VSFNDAIIDEFRANGGAVNRFGSDLVLVHTVGAKSGVERVHPLMGIRDGDGWLVAASKGGAPEHPGWYHNLLAHPQTVVEVPDGHGSVATVPVSASVLQGAEHDAGWAQFVRRSPAFADYDVRSGARRIPVVKLSPR